MSIFINMNERVKKFNVIDVKLLQLTAVFLVLIVVKLIPRIMNISIWWFVVLLVLCAIKPLYVLFIKK